MSMGKETRKFKVGDQLPDSWLGSGWTVVSTKRASEGAIEIRNDTPEHAERVQKALEDYAAAVREDQMRPREEPPRRNWYFDSPLD